MTSSPAPIVAVSLSIEGRPSSLRVHSVEGREGLSTLFEIDVRLLPGDADELPKVGDRATVSLTVGDRTRDIHGMVRTVEQDDDIDASCRSTIVPAAYVLALREDCRVFEGMRVPEIIEAVLEAAGFVPGDYRLVLHAEYRLREHCVQYRETDWAFLGRLLESEGIHCFFDHEGDREVLVFTDNAHGHRRMAHPDVVPHATAAGALSGSERVHRFRHVEELRAGSVSLRGHSFRAPLARLESRADAKTPGIVIHDAPPDFDAAEQGDRLARLRLEQEATSRATAHGASDCLGIQPGVVFTLADLPSSRIPRDWLVTSAEHHVTVGRVEEGGENRASYENRFTAIGSDTPYRSKTRTPKPVAGIQTAVVIGPPGQEVHCDELGRVKVRFHWDREDEHDDRASSWVRVSQAWAGPGYGSLFVPRVGHGVLVDFVDGDLDRPIVVGSVYDAVNAPPASLPLQRTATVLRSASTADGTRHSELRMDSQSGREHVHLESCRDLGVRVGQDKDELVGGNEWLKVGGDRDAQVAGSETLTVAESRDLSVGGMHRVSVGANETKTVGGTHTVEVGGNRSVEVKGHMTEVVGERLEVRVGGDRSESITGSSRTLVTEARSIETRSQSLEVHEDLRVRVDGNVEERVGKIRRSVVGETIEIVCGETLITAHKDGSVTLSGKSVRAKVNGPIEVEGGKLTVKSQGAVHVNAQGAVRVRGRGVALN